MGWSHRLESVVYDGLTEIPAPARRSSITVNRIESLMGPPDHWGNLLTTDHLYALYLYATNAKR